MGTALEEAPRRVRRGALDERSGPEREAARGAPEGRGRAGGGVAMRPRPGSRTFIALWTLATVATVCAFLVHLALRGRTVSLGYELGRARAEQARLREVKRVLEV